MDKSFNDEELSDIMKEIEALEEDFKGPEDKYDSPLMEELAELEESHSIPTPAAKVVNIEAAKPQVSKSSSVPGTSMSFKVQGQLNLELQFDIGGKVVCLEVSEQGLNIEMEGGVKFFVPVSASKKAV